MRNPYQGMYDAAYTAKVVHSRYYDVDIHDYVTPPEHNDIVALFNAIEKKWEEWEDANV